MDAHLIKENQELLNYVGKMTERDKHSIGNDDKDTTPTGLHRFNSRYKAYIQDESE